MDPMEKISLFDSLFYAALAIAIIGLAFAVFFFFYFKIPEVYALMSGRSRKKALEQMYERNVEGKSIRQKAETGNIRKRAAVAASLEIGGQTGGLSGGLSGGLAYDPPQAQHLSDNGGETVPLGEAATTSVLREEDPGTVPLKQSEPREEEAGATAILARPSAAPADNPQYHFRIREHVLLVHSDKTI